MPYLIRVNIGNSCLALMVYVSYDMVPRFDRWMPHTYFVNDESDDLKIRVFITGKFLAKQGS